MGGDIGWKGLVTSTGGTAGVAKPVYAATTAIGLSDGSSWGDAYTDIETAFETADAGAVIYTDAPEASPFSPFTGTVNDNLTWKSAEGASGETWISNGRKATWVDEGGGVFSCTPIAEPLYAAYDFKRDDTDGTVTGVNLNDARYAEALASQSWSKADLVAWYGFLTEADPATTTPAEGEWSYTGGTLYINPPGSPASVDDDAIYSIAVTGAAAFTSTATNVQNFHHTGRLITHFTPGTSLGNGYGFRFTDGKDCTMEDVLSIASGYHAGGFSGDSLTGNTINNCASTSGSGGIPYVFYANEPILNAGHVGSNIIGIMAPYMKTDGSPLSDSYAGSGEVGYSHSDGVSIFGGIRWIDIVSIDPSDLIATKHSLTLGVPQGRFIGARNNNYTVIDPSDTSTYDVSVTGGYAIGPACGPDVNVLTEGVTINNLGEGQFIWSFGTSPAYWVLGVKNCVWNVTGTTTIGVPYDQISAGRGYVYLEGNTITVESAGTQGLFKFVEPEPTQALILKDNIIDHSGVGGALLTVVNTMSQAAIIAAPSVQSLGGNTFKNNVSSPVRNAGGTEVFSVSEFLSAFGAAGDTYEA